MTPAQQERLTQIASRRWRIAAVLTVVMLVAYFGFILLIAFAKPTMGTLLMRGGLSVGVLLGAAVILLTPALTAIYVHWANDRHDAELDALRAEVRS
jgi:uncharacterized membrane protein (DUF485 family)